MKIKILNWLLIIDILTVFLILTIVFIPSNIIRIVISLPFILFFPGWTLVAAFFPPKRSIPSDTGDITPNAGKDEKKDINQVERIAISFGMNIAIVALIGLGLNYTSWGIKLVPTLLSISVFTIIASCIAIIRQYRSVHQILPTTELEIKLPRWEGSALNKAITVILVLGVLGAAGVLAYTMAVQKVGEQFSEFYVLGISGKAYGYPSAFILKNNQVITVQYNNGATTLEGIPGKVTLGIVNHERQNTDYSVAITIDGQLAEIYFGGKILTRVEQIDLPQGGKWEQEIGFIPHHGGDNQKVEFLLFKDGGAEPENTLQLWVNVKEE